MIPKNIAALFLLYARPVTALGQILDRGSAWFSLAIALVVSWLLHLSDGAPAETPSALSILFRVLSLEPGSWVFPLGVIAVALVPGVLLVRAISGHSSFGILMESDYLGLVSCALMSWSAAFLPLAVAGFAAPGLVHTLPVFVAGNLYFTVLLGLSVRTVFGTGFGPATGMAVLGWAAALVAGGLFGVVGGSLRFLASPLILYYAYLMLGSDVRSVGQGFRSRQRLREQLEIATNNPRDADAHYQIGLIHQQRRQYTEAIARFTRAVEIDPEETGAQFQLGRIAIEQGRFEDAIARLRLAASQDDKHATSEVWRELGAANFGASKFEEAAVALAKFTDRRAYDPEGLYWYGKTLLRLGRPAEARDLFERSIEGAKTMPRHRRAEVRKWGSLSKGELSALKRAV